MSDPRISDPHVLDQPWRIWASIVVIGILLFGVALGVLIIPVVQGRSAGIDMYTAICRALGILPGSPAQPQPATVSPPTPVSKVVWTPEVLQILARGNPFFLRDDFVFFDSEDCLYFSHVVSWFCVQNPPPHLGRYAS